MSLAFFGGGLYRMVGEPVCASFKHEICKRSTSRRCLSRLGTSARKPTWFSYELWFCRQVLIFTNAYIEASQSWPCGVGKSAQYPGRMQNLNALWIFPADFSRAWMIPAPLKARSLSPQT